MRRVSWMLTMPVLTTLGLTACAPAGGRAAEPAEPTLERCLVSLIDEAKVPAREPGVLVQLTVREGDVVSRDEVLARIDRRSGPDTIVAVRQGPLVATSFHPELTGDTRIHEMFIDMVRQYT